MLRRHLAYFAVLTSAIGAATISLEIAGVHLSLFRLAVILSVVTLAIDGLYKVGKGRHNTRKNLSVLIAFPHKFMVLWLIVCLFSVIWSLDMAAWARASFFVFIGTAVTFIFSSTFTEKRHFRIVFCLMSIMVVLHNVIGWYEISSGELLFLENNTQFYADNELAASTFGNTNDFATYLLMSLSVLLIAARSLRRKWLKLVMYATCISSILLIFNTESRANILAIAIWLIIVIATQARTPQRVIGAVFFSVILVISLLFVNLGRILSLLGIDSILNFTFDNAASSDGVRLNLAKNGLHFLLETTLLGTGAGNIEYWMENRAVYPTAGVLNIHNWWLEILVSFGLVVFLGYLSMNIYLIGKLIYATWKSKDSLIREYSSLLAANLVAFVVSSVSSSSNLAEAWLWVYFAVVISFTTRIQLLEAESRNLPRNLRTSCTGIR